MLKLPANLVDEIFLHAQEESPNECCGIISGIGYSAKQVYRMENVVEDSKKPYRYEIDGKELLKVLDELDKRNEELIIIYHSHTGSEAYPSPTDVRFAQGWPDSVFVIVSLKDPNEPVIRAFRIQNHEILEEEIQRTYQGILQ